MMSKSTKAKSPQSKRLKSASAKRLPLTALVRAAIAWTPAAYAKRGVKFLLEHAAAGLLLDPGLGKTSITLAAIKILMREGAVDRVLVIAPMRVCHLVWPKEVAKWKDFEHLRVSILHGSRKEKALEEDADIYLINPEGLPWLLEAGKGRFKKLRADMLVVDESSKFKNTQTLRFKTLRPFLPKFRRRVILTGTPAPNGLMDLFGQVYILDLGNAFGPYITHYRREFFTPTGYGGFNYKLDKGADKRIYSALKKLVLRMDAEDYLTLPKLITNRIEVELPSAARKVYDELEAEMFSILEGGQEVAAISAGVLTMKLRQVANGGLYYGVGEVGEKTTRKSVVLHDEKTEAIAELVEELNGSPLLVAYEFQHDLERLRARFGKNTPFIGSGVSPRETGRIEAAWNSGRIPLLFGQSSAMSHGLNFQEGGCSHIAWHSLIWDYETYDQFIRRVRRQGNNADRVIVHHVVANDTVDDVILSVLGFKHRTQKKLLDALRARRK